MKQRASFICGGKYVPASRFRVHPVAQYLNNIGWCTRIIHGYGELDQKLGNEYVRRAYRLGCRIQRAVRTANLQFQGPVLVQRLALPWLSAPERRLTKHCSSVIFDFDDAVFLSHAGEKSFLRKMALDSVFLAASHVVAGNSWLAEHVPNNVRVTVIPTCIDTSLYAPLPTSFCSRPIRIGWIGTSSNLKHLAQLIDSIATLRKKGWNFEFIICSDVKPQYIGRDMEYEFIKWSPESEMKFLHSIDIGVMPLDDDFWCRGKCSFKLIQYMAVGCPVVASPVGFNNDVVEDGVSGFLVKNGDWETPIATLMEEPEIRQAMGISARQRVVEQFDIGVAALSYKHIFEQYQ